MKKFRDLKDGNRIYKIDLKTGTIRKLSVQLGKSYFTTIPYGEMTWRHIWTEQGELVSIPNEDELLEYYINLPRGAIYLTKKNIILEVLGRAQEMSEKTPEYPYLKNIDTLILSL